MRILVNHLLIFFLLFLSTVVISQNNLKVGWSQVDITPDKPVLIAGQFHARVSEGVLDPITATVLVLESGEDVSTSEKVIFVSCDLVSISDGTRDDQKTNLLSTVRSLVSEELPELGKSNIVMNATHTHAAPYCGTGNNIEQRYGVDLDAMTPYEYLGFMAKKVANGVIEAWENRAVGGISYGLANAVVGHNRLQAQLTGKSLMYGNTNQDDFSHIEGFEDHSVNLLYTWDLNENLTGIVMNVACPSQVSEHEYKLSADYWHDVRENLRSQLGDQLYVLAQCGSAGDQSPHFMYDKKGKERMQELLFPDYEPGRGTIARRKQIAKELTHSAIDILPVMKENIQWRPLLQHKSKILHLSRRLLTPEDLTSANEGAITWNKRYEDLLNELKVNPDKMGKDRWYRDITQAYGRYRWYKGVATRYELEKSEKTIPIEVHVVRLGDIVLATNPFELYLDYGVRMKAQSPAVQTFIVQLAGSGSYVPTKRSIKGGAYGAVASSTLIGPEGGQELVEETLLLINGMW